MATQDGFTARVFMSEARIPIPNAYVTVTRTNDDGANELVAYLVTDRDGLTKSFMLPAPDKGNSLLPNGCNYQPQRILVINPHENAEPIEMHYKFRPTDEVIYYDSF